MSMPANTPDGKKAPKTAQSSSTRGMLPVENSSRTSQRTKSWKQLLSSVSASTAIHVIVLFVLSCFYFDLPQRLVLDSILLLVGADNEPLGDQIEIDLRKSSTPTIDAGKLADSSDLIVPMDELIPSVSTDLQPVMIPGQDQSHMAVSAPAPNSSAAKSPTTGKVASRSTTKKGIVAEVEVQHPDHFVGRSPVAKKALLKSMGGTDASEAAVARGLEWLKNHQLQDGSWNFYHLFSPRCDCTMPGTLANNPNAATAMALLAFLGAGHTGDAGEYKEQVRQGLDFLLANGMPAEKGICFYGHLVGPPTYYTHGLVTIALSEAFAMTGDARLRPSVAGAIEFLVATQESGGGWRYFPGQPGDTSVVAWQLMGLKSAQFSRIPIPQKVFTGVDRFMKSVASMRGTQYAYIPGRDPTYSMTAAGLLCRMYLETKDNNAALKAGIKFLDEHGPEPDGMYYNYYATQVMHHWGGPEWNRWNNVMRDHLVQTQIADGHATGSWDPADRHGNVGGRLYMTTLALLTLEVYYRHLPLYQKDRIELPLLNEAAEMKAAPPK